MSDRTVRDHSKPCKHEYPDGAQPDTVYGGVDWQQGQTARKVWKCNTFGCPGGREIVLREEPRCHHAHRGPCPYMLGCGLVWVEVTE